jgi:hypothetical protein
MIQAINTVGIHGSPRIKEIKVGSRKDVKPD